MRTVLIKIGLFTFLLNCFCHAFANEVKNDKRYSYLTGTSKPKGIYIAMNNTSLVNDEDQPPFADTDKSVRDSIEKTFSTIATNATWIDNITDNMSVGTPFGMHKVTDGNTYEIAFAKISFGKTGAVARVYARCIVPQKSTLAPTKTLYFAGFVSLARGGGVISDGKLFLVGNDVVSCGDHFSLNLTGISPGSTGSTTSASYFKFDCSGFTELGINGNVTLSNKYTVVDAKTFKAAASGSVVSAPVVVTLTNWNNLYAENLKFSGSFSSKDLPGYVFSITTGTLDFTDTKNPSNDRLKTYISSVQSVLPNTWRGLHITGIDVYLPNYLNAPNATDKAKVFADYATIDDNGFTVKASGSNLVDIKKGSANGWPMSVTRFDIDIQKSAIVGAGFSGKLVLPVEDKNSDRAGVPYTANLNSDGGYDVTHKEIDAIKADMWKGYLIVDPSFEVTMAVKNERLMPKVSLSGRFSFSFNGGKLDPIPPKEDDKKKKYSFAIEDASFEELVLQTEAPFMDVKSLGTSSQLQIAKFSADVSVEYQKKRPVDNDPKAEYSCLHFDANIQLMEGKIGGGAGFDIYSKYDTAKREWKYDSYKLTQVKLNAEFGKVSFDGTLDFMNDSIYGKGFNGVVKLKVSTIEVKAGAMFGTKTNADGSDFKYWNVDAYVKGLNIKLFNVIEIQGFSGGATYQMDPVPADAEHPVTASGVSYVPNESSFLRVRAGIFLALVNKKVVSGWGGLEIVFNKNWGVDEFSISGNAQFFSQGVDEKSDKNKITPLTKGNKKTQASRLADAAAKAPPVKTPKTPKPVQTVKVAPKITSKPMVDKDGKPLTSKKGKPLVSKTTEKTLAKAVKDKSGKTLLDKSGKPIESTTATKTTSRIAKTRSGKPILDASGEPIMVNATRKVVNTPVLDKAGKPVLDEKGNATFETQVQYITPKVLKDKKGNVMYDKKGNPIIKYKVRNKKKKPEEAEEDEPEEDDELELPEGSDDPEAEADKPNEAGDAINDAISDDLMEADNPDISDAAQDLLVAKKDMETADAERKIADKNRRGPDSLVALLKQIIANTQSSGNGNFQNTPVMNHNVFRSWLGGEDKAAWPKVCALLNIPYNTDDISSTKKGNYSTPTQTRINKVRDSVKTNYDAASAVATPVRTERNNLSASQLYKDCKICAENWSNNRDKCKITTDAEKNKTIISDWKKKRDSIVAVYNALDAKVTRLTDSANLIYNVYFILSDKWDYAKKGNSNLLNAINVEMTYYNEIANKRNNLADSLERYSTNVAIPLGNIANEKTAIYNDKLATYNTLLTKYNSLVTINDAKEMAEKAKGARVKLATGVILTAAEKALIKSSDSLNTIAAPLQDNLNQQALTASADKIKQNAEVKSAMSKALADAKAKVDQLKSNPNSAEYKDAVQLQARAQNNLEAFNTQIQQDSTRFKQDSALIAYNIISNNGGPVITVTPYQLYYINKTYATTVTKEPAGSVVSAAFYVVNNTEAASVNMYNRKAAAIPKMVTEYGSMYVGGKYSYWSRPSEDLLSAIKADEEAVAKATLWLNEADSVKLDSTENAQIKADKKINAVMPVGTRPDGSPPFWGNFLAKVDLANEVLSFNMDVYASYEAGNVTLFEGNGANKLAGSGEIYYSKKKWYVSLGTKENPMGLKVNMWPISGKATTYFQATNLLQSDGSDIVIKHGFSVDVQFNWSGGPAYAKIGGGIGYDILIKHKDDFICTSTNQPAGLYGWYGKGNIRAYLAAEAGVKFFGHEFSVLSGSINADLDVRGPNPVYLKGSLLVKYSVGCCSLSWDGDFNVNMETGTYCAFDDK